VRFTIGLPTDRVEHAAEFLTADGVAACAAAAEDAGFDACFVTDHPAPDAKWLEGGGHHALDPFVALSFAAAATTSLRVQTHILVLPYRNPLLTAKAVLSLDVLSGGRVILGVASGYLKPEFAALGVDFDERNALTDEAIDVMRALWTDGELAYEGRHFRTRGTVMRPGPVQRPHPPVWVGGNSTRAIRRAVERGQGWVPFPNPAGTVLRVRTPELSTLEQLAQRMQVLRDHAAAVGRIEPIDVCFAPLSIRPMISGRVEYDAAEVVDEVRRLEELGVTWCVAGAPGATTRAEYTDAARRFADTVIARV
jgi:probable F420-dependent oxidoreductase